ncbi:OmpA family protein [Marinomonas sp. 15G1-11]|uniref:OmpA family protein n=1 Tax=Marinomonas phaeophyticola TaxID=3004091 RepID=A0ABT4JUH9_9GAMM|nr:OmpA family protein [Marinomonas sp. 15G1-11]MCZ2722052.1 OmpA family protein [Marinomonas sp. 15G1-11]
MKTIGLLICALVMSSQAIALSVYGDQVSADALKDQDQDGVINIRDACPDTPVNAAVDNIGCHEDSTKLLSMELNILFDTGKYDVKPVYYSEVKKLADFLNQNVGSTTVIEGHTDSIGSDEYNQNLSQNRASSILNVLINSFKIDAFRVKAVGFGESKPIASNATKEGRARNRRVVAEVFAQSTQKIERWDIYSVDK